MLSIEVYRDGAKRGFAFPEHPCFSWLCCSCISSASSRMITTYLAWWDLWVSGHVFFCGSLPCWVRMVFQFVLSKIVEIAPLIMCQHAAKYSHIAVKSGSINGCALQTLVRLLLLLLFWWNSAEPWLTTVLFKIGFWGRNRGSRISNLLAFGYMFSSNCMSSVFSCSLSFLLHLTPIMHLIPYNAM